MRISDDVLRREVHRLHRLEANLTAEQRMELYGVTRFRDLVGAERADDAMRTGAILGAVSGALLGAAVVLLALSTVPEAPPAPAPAVPCAAPSRGPVGVLPEGE